MRGKNADEFIAMDHIDGFFIDSKNIIRDVKNIKIIVDQVNKADGPTNFEL